MRKINFRNIKKDDGFMGRTHVLSAIAIYLLFVAVLKDYLLKIGFQQDNILLLLNTVVIAGASCLPDLDGAKSTAMSVLGYVGNIISKTMRTTSTMIFTITRTKYDEKEADPHRGFWHTILSAFLVGFIIHLLLLLNINITIPIIEKNFNLMGFLWIFITIQMAMSVLLNSFVKKQKKNIIGNIILFIIGTIISLTLIILNKDYNWLVYSIVLGYIIHIIGDTFTVAGTPLLYPFKFKGKRWFNHRFLKIKAGGTIENIIFVPLFSIIIFISLFIIIKGG